MCDVAVYSDGNREQGAGAAGGSSPPLKIFLPEGIFTDLESDLLHRELGDLGIGSAIKRVDAATPRGIPDLAEAWVMIQDDALTVGLGVLSAAAWDGFCRILSRRMSPHAGRLTMAFRWRGGIVKVRAEGTEQEVLASLEGVRAALEAGATSSGRHSYRTTPRD